MKTTKERWDELYERTRFVLDSYDMAYLHDAYREMAQIARHAAREPIMREVETFERELRDYGFNCANDDGHVSGMVEEFKERMRALLDDAGSDPRLCEHGVLAYSCMSDDHIRSGR